MTFTTHRRGAPEPVRIAAFRATAKAVRAVVLVLAAAQFIPIYPSAGQAADRAIRRESKQFEKNMRQRLLIDRLKQSGALKPATGSEDAQRADAALIYRHLVDERGLSPEDAIARLKAAGYPTDHLRTTDP